MATKRAIGLIFAAFVQEYGANLFSASKEKAALYERLLDDIPDDVLEMVAAHCMTLHEFPPRVSQLRKAALALMKGDADRVTAGEAWAEVNKAFRYCSSELDAKQRLGPRIWKCVEALGGWRTLGMSENVMADRAHFLKIYDAIAERDRDDRLMLPEVRELAKRLADGMKARALPEGAP